MQQLNTPAPAGTASQPASRLRLSWLQPVGLLALSAVNAVLRLLTLGIYNFWGKTEVRRRIWSAVRLDGEPLQYTGTGKELFLGFLMVFAAILLPIMLGTYAVVLALGPQSAALGVFQIALYAFFFFLTGIAIFRAQRYRLSRTTWRGIRGSLTGSDRDYAWTYFWTGLLIPPTLCWILPWRATKLQGMLTNATRFGNRPFHFSAAAGPLYRRFAILWVGTVVIALAAFAALRLALPAGTMEGMATDEPVDITRFVTLLAAFYGVLAVAVLAYMLLSAVYRARMMNHFAAHTRYETAGFRSTATGGGLVRLAIGNFLLWLSGWSIGLFLFLLAVGVAQPVLAAQPESAAGHALIWIAAFILLASSGLLTPIVQARNARYVVENLAIEGTLALGDILQGQDQGIRRGEGLAQALDIDAF